MEARFDGALLQELLKAVAIVGLNDIQMIDGAGLRVLFWSRDLSNTFKAPIVSACIFYPGCSPLLDMTHLDVQDRSLQSFESVIMPEYYVLIFLFGAVIAY